eukprot:Blabericola_migrator_1__5951@NODE_2_length_32877_cov_165_790003_g1_i0_p19_GENE_NODE_2_length_32877_cov_165_790003_g1_i0NODE_2_length_32877_cov_165_790003_g1_i0_p19_ORF_typecomplete_len205_score20_81NUDIX/PF00293_28/3_8e07WHH/PF14414_6/5_4e03WHH/PF14414_6/18WHH/PF14414_6/29_NODE_2_length_32877_cov_165_790003_g1_i06191233
MKVLQAITVLMSLVQGNKHHEAKKEVQRAFMITHIKDRGFLLMEAYKKNKGRHAQLLGGRIDPADFEALGLPTDHNEVTMDELVRVGQHAALRELYEETGIDLNGHYEQVTFLPGVTHQVAKRKKNMGTMPGHARHPRKLYYLLELPTALFNATRIELSREHVGYTIQPDIIAAAQAALAHSGGDSAYALEVFERELIVFFPPE